MKQKIQVWGEKAPRDFFLMSPMLAQYHLKKVKNELKYLSCGYESPSHYTQKKVFKTKISFMEMLLQCVD